MKREYVRNNYKILITKTVKDRIFKNEDQTLLDYTFSSQSYNEDYIDSENDSLEVCIYTENGSDEDVKLLQKQIDKFDGNRRHLKIYYGLHENQIKEDLVFDLAEIKRHSNAVRLFFKLVD